MGERQFGDRGISENARCPEGDAVKAYEVEMSGRVAAPVLDILLPYNEIFVLGSDGKRHPTKEEIEDQEKASRSQYHLIADTQIINRSWRNRESSAAHHRCSCQRCKD